MKVPKPQLNSSKPHRKRRSTTWLWGIFALWLNNGFTPWLMPVLAQVSPSPGTSITNRAIGSFRESGSSDSLTTVESNEVIVRVSEVAGITVVASGSNDDGDVNPNDLITFDFTITNVGNDPTQFFIPGAPSSVTNGSFSSSNPIQIIAYDPDGAGTEASSQAVSINIPNTGLSTGNVSGLDLPNGSIPAGGTVTVRVPVTVDSGAIAGNAVSVTLGETTPDGSGSTQNQPYTANTSDLYTQDNQDSDSVDSSFTVAVETETVNAPANGVREASASQDSGVINPNQTIDATPSPTACSVQGGTLSGVNLFTPLDNGTMGFENGDPDQSPATNPYPGIVSGGIYAQYNSGSGSFRNPTYGQYSYVANMQNARNDYQHEGITDPVYGVTGRYFVSDPNENTPEISVTLTGLTPNQFYEYSFWAANAEPSTNGNNNNIDVIIGGQTIYSTGPLPEVSSALAWQKHTVTFTNGPETSITVVLKSTETGNGGNDFNLDNIELQECNFAVDYGDAPLSYGEVLHTTIPTTPTVFLGNAPDSEATTPLGGDNGVGADGDTDDAFTSLPDVPLTGAYDLTNIPVTNTSGNNATLHGWVDFNQNGTFEVNEYSSTTVASGATIANLNWTIPSGTSTGNTIARFRISPNALIPDDVATPTVDERSRDAVINGEAEDYTVAIAAFVSNPDVLLVKRITAINGEVINPNDGTTQLDQVVDDTTSTRQTDDNDAGWPANYLIGALNAGPVKPGDEIEYTIYFLSAGNLAAEEVRICDRFQPGISFQLGSDPSRTAASQSRLGSADAQLRLGTSAIIDLTAANDPGITGDRAQLFTAGDIPNNCNLSALNDHGTFVIDITGAANTGTPALTELPNSSSQGAPNDSYGFFRFITTVDE